MMCPHAQDTIRFLFGKYFVHDTVLHIDATRICAGQTWTPPPTLPCYGISPLDRLVQFMIGRLAGNFVIIARQPGVAGAAFPD
jgi:hypothetical protein